ncbi:MAG TPA: hypothetical protein VNR00_20355, partial [Opitutus sp.]|nr:hypothetical protein [Opitutus sp.]
MRKLSPGALSRWLLLLGFALTILGAKFWLIQRAGSDLPVLDQWDGEAEFALRPWLENRLTAADILKPHNEHRIVTTKLQTLALTALNRQWDGYVETVFNAFIHLASAVLLLWCARRWLRGPPFFWFGLLLLLLFSLPFSWENTLVGFQAQFYYLLLFSLGHLIFSLESERFTVRWALGQLCAVLALATMATGFLSALAVLSALGYRLVRERRWTPQQILTALLAGAAVVAGWAMKVDVAGHAILKAHTPFQFVFALLQLLAWPGPWFLPLVFAPAAIFIWRALRRGAGNAPDPVLLGLLSWSLLQALALAYGRGGGAVEASRYTDLLAINVAVGGLLILRQARPWFVGAWMVVVIGGLLTRSVHEATGAIGSLPEIHQRQQELVRAYVANGDPAVFENQTWPEIPYPSAPVLRQRLDTPGLRAILPWSVRTPIRLREETMPRDPHSAPTLPRGNWEIALSTRGEPEAEREEVSWRSDPVATSTLPVLRFLVAGDLGNGSPRLRLTIKSREGETSVIPEAPSGERWKRVTVARPAGEWWIEATDGDPRGWFAFTRPIEMGWT